MGKLIISMGASLDGFFEGLDHNIAWHKVDEEYLRFMNDQERSTGAYLWGRSLYENMNAYWPTAGANPENPDYVIEFARIYESIPKFVFSKTLNQVEGNATLVKENILEVVPRLKSQIGKNLEVGGAKLANSMIRLGLVDEIRYFVQPVILGRGISLFQDLEKTIRLKLINTHKFTIGVVLLHYQVEVSSHPI